MKKIVCVAAGIIILSCDKAVLNGILYNPSDTAF